MAGTEKALDAGLAPVAAACPGVTTAVGGGVRRDVIAREVPALVRVDSALYAVPAVVGALVVGIASTRPQRRRRNAFGPELDDAAVSHCEDLDRGIRRGPDPEAPDGPLLCTFDLATPES